MSTQQQDTDLERDDLEEPEVDPPLRPGEGEDGLLPSNATTAPPPATADWKSGLDEETKALVEAKGWKSLADMAKSYREAESSLGRERSRADQEAREKQEIARLLDQGRQAIGGTPQQNQGDPFQIEQLGELWEAGEISFKDALGYLTTQVFPAIADARAQQYVAPVAMKTQEAELRETVAQMEDTYPDFRELSTDVLALMQREPDEYQGSRGMRRAYAMVKADRDARTAHERARAARAETIDQGSVGQRATVDAAAIIRERIRGATPRIEDGI
ncbi:MAG TPA: hypothetical protein VJP59_00240 [Gemmatimonadota bacterium]|nr:hypothetical protein [Gemmatimonadota bacterium]